ncbi:MAG: metallophosphoesterase family protein [Thermoanaerobaculia bacterium]|nr:metallophosphoesterase family protein [Thermoanaerobaculia bacterium]
MTVAVLADAHIGGPGGAPGPLLSQLRDLDPDAHDRLIVLGDLFQAWVGFPRFETPEVVELTEAFADLRRRGIAVEYVEGNRDFFLRGSPYENAFDRVGLETSFHAGDRRFLAVHGDGLDEGDVQYRVWRAVSKSAASRFFMKRLPRTLAHRMVRGTERRLSETNFKHKQRIPREAVTAYAEGRLAEGFDVLLLGHFHEPQRWEVEGGEVRLLDAWFRSRRIETFGDGT